MRFFANRLYGDLNFNFRFADVGVERVFERDRPGVVKDVGLGAEGVGFGACFRVSTTKVPWFESRRRDAPRVFGQKSTDVLLLRRFRAVTGVHVATAGACPDSLDDRGWQDKEVTERSAGGEL